MNKLTKTENELLKYCGSFNSYTAWVYGKRNADAALKLIEKGLAREISRDFQNNWSICIKVFGISEVTK